MKVEIARIPSSSIAPNEAFMVDIPNNLDGLTAVIVRSSKKLTAWINSCPHDGDSFVMTQNIYGTKSSIGFNACTIRQYLSQIQAFVMTAPAEARI